MGKVVTNEKVLVVVTLMAMLVVIWVVLERFMGGFEIGQINDGGIRLLDLAAGKRAGLDEYLFPEKEKLAHNIEIG